MRDLLIRYLLGELDVAQRQQLENELQNSPELRQELDYLRACYASAQSDEPVADDLPSGLAERTVTRVEDCNSDEDVLALGRPTDRPLAYCPGFDSVPGSAASWSMADLTVAAGVFLAVSMLFLPALRQSRDAARRNDCANKMRQIGTLLIQFSDQHNGYYPMVATNENAGIFAVRLVDQGFVSADVLSRLLVCRSSPLGERVANGQVAIHIPVPSELRQATPEQLAVLQELMGGSYAYRIGYMQGENYFNVRDSRCPRTPVLADAPYFRRSDVVCVSHGGCGQNVLYQDQSVRYTCSYTLPDRNNDHLFLNTKGHAAAGCGPLDMVLGPSDIKPGADLPDNQESLSAPSGASIFVAQP
jgi:Protein of unknown function (DUF1559)